MSTSGIGTVRPSSRYTTLDLVIIAVLGVVFGLLNTPFGVLFQFLQTTFGPLGQAVFAPWAISMVLTGLIVRKPGAALINGMVNGIFQVLSGNPAGLVNLLYGLALGGGTEVILLAGGYRGIGFWRASISGGFACLCSYIVSFIVYHYISAGLGVSTVSGIVQGLAGVVESGMVAWVLGYYLRRSGLLKSFSAGQA